jgi:hypothetical protein
MDMSLPSQLRAQVESFLSEHDLGSLYKDYRWARDTWEDGFPAMRQLERDLSMSAANGYLTKPDIMRVAKWGHLFKTKGIQCSERVGISLYDGDDLAEFFRIAAAPLEELRGAIKGMGPTYLSKLLMFSRPQLYGAIDTRLVRVFGRGDASVEGHRWLSLEVKNYGDGWHIPERQSSWPSQYSVWIEILHYVADLCNTRGHKCPHPDDYVAAGLRDKGVWIAADIETALFSYASKRLGKQP